jgi:DNA-binding MarR family transcriptional regulator
MSDSITFSGDQKAKLTQLVNEGMQVMREVETLNEGLRDTVKAVAEELQIKPSILNKAIKIAHKAEFTKEQQDHQLLEDILSTVGHTL